MATVPLKSFVPTQSKDKAIPIINNRSLDDFEQTDDGNVTPYAVSAEIREMVKRCRIGLTDEIYPPEYILHIGDAPVMGLSDFSLVIGKAKSRKTFVMTLLMAAMLAKVIEQLKADGYDGKTRLIWFDTEQSRYYVQRAYQAALRLAGIDNAPELEVYSLRPFSYHERKNIVNQVLYVDNTENNVLFAIIDGIRDLVSDINDAEQATDTATWLMKITAEKGMHITTVLHTNKSDNNARGHLGAELTNKAQTTMIVEKCPENTEMSIVKPDYCRDRDFEPFAFHIDEQGLPQVTEDYSESTTPVQKAKFSPYSYEPDAHRRIAKDVFSKTTEYGYSDLFRAIKLAFEHRDVKIGDNRAKDVLKHWQNIGIIQADERSTRRRYSLTSLTSLNQFNENP